MTSQNAKGYAVHDTKNWSKFDVIDFKLKSAEDYDIDIKIEYCGVCGSDVHTITGGWGEPNLPVVPGHEITGTVTRVGPKVTEFKVGDRAGVGAQVCSCLECKNCKSDNENYCPKALDTYNASYPNGDVAQGGYSTAIRAHERFVFAIPESISLAQAAPMLCAGITTYSPLVRHGAKPGASVGVVGVGGLGHYAIQWAKALECKNIVVFSHSESKKDDAKAMGATDFVLTDKKGFAESYAGELDVIIVTTDISNAIPVSDLIPALTVHGRLILCAMPDDELPAFKSQSLAGNGALIGGSHIGSKKEIIAMLKLASEKGVKSWIEELPMSQCGKAVQNVKDNKIRYRHVLKMDL